jgi:hypothetical protein
VILEVLAVRCPGAQDTKQGLIQKALADPLILLDSLVPVRS